MPLKSGKFVVYLIALVISFAVDPHWAKAQTTLGNVATDTISTASCSTLSADRGGFDSAYFTECHEAKVSGCSNADDLSFFYGIAPPTNQTHLGTIVMFSGLGGRTIPSIFSAYVQAYTGAGYQVIEVVWGGNIAAGQDWESINTMGGSHTPNILNAACRPASVLNWIRNGSDTTQVGKGLWGNYLGGMCVHADSAGAGAVGYALTWYYGSVGGTPVWGKGYIDKAMLTNGPVFSDVQQGCEFTNGANNQSTYICANGATEPGCGIWSISGGPAPQPYQLEYGDVGSSIDFWSGGSASGVCGQGTTYACAANTYQKSTCSAENTLWYNQSIVNFPASGQQPSFSYPNTGLSGYSCATVDGPNNNSSPEAQLFFNQFQSSSQSAGVVFSGSFGCPSVEKVEQGTVYNGTQTFNGQAAVIDDMTGVSPWSPSLSCGSLKRQ